MNKITFKIYEDDEQHEMPRARLKIIKSDSIYYAQVRYKMIDQAMDCFEPQGLG